MKLDLLDIQSDNEPVEQINHRHQPKTSGRARTAHQALRKSVDWPHFYVLKGANRKSTTFDELQADECAYGCLKMIENRGSHAIQSV